MEIFVETDTHRVTINLDEYPEAPEDEGSSPVIGWDGYDGSVDQVELGSTYRLPQSVLDAAQAFRNDHDLFERYCRMFHGVTTFKYYETRNASYVTFDPADWREHVGAHEGSISMDEWIAYLQGDVYFVNLEQKVTWTRSDTGEVKTDWDIIDSLSGLCGYDAAVDASEELVPKA